MSGNADASLRLRRALTGDARRNGLEIMTEDIDWTPWASVTFSGARHRLAIRAPASDRTEQWLAALPECELTLPGHLLADLTVSDGVRNADTYLATIEALTVEN